MIKYMIEALKTKQKPRDKDLISRNSRVRSGQLGITNRKSCQQPAVMSHLDMLCVRDGEESVLACYRQALDGAELHFPISVYNHKHTLQHTRRRTDQLAVFATLSPPAYGTLKVKCSNRTRGSVRTQVICKIL